jgi:hypothetical protein
MNKKHHPKRVMMTEQWMHDLVYSLKAPKYEIVESGSEYRMKKIEGEWINFKIWDNVIYTLIVQQTCGSSFIYSNSVDIGKFMDAKQGHIKNNGYTVFQDNTHSSCQKVQESIKRLREAGYLVVLQTKGKNLYLPTVRFLFNQDFNVVTGFASGSHENQVGIWKNESHKQLAFSKQEKDKQSAFAKSLAREQRIINQREKEMEKSRREKERLDAQQKIAFLTAECERLRGEREQRESPDEENITDFDDMPF